MNDINLQERRTEIYMRYINQFRKLTRKAGLYFTDIDNTYPKEDDCNVYLWLMREIYSSPEQIKNIMTKYKDTYPDAYDILLKKINNKKDRYDKKEKIEIFLKYINDNNIPSGRSQLRFCDICPEANDTSRIGIWFQSILEYEKRNLLKIIEIYKNIYPNAYEKIIYRTITKNEENYTEKRMTTMVKFLSKYYLREKDKFCDIGGEKHDTNHPLNWFLINEEKDYDKMHLELKKACIKENVDYNIIYQKIYSNRKKTDEYTVKDIRKIETLLLFLENNNFQDLHNNIKFKSINPNIKEETYINYWFNRIMQANREKFIQEVENYKEIYPIGYQKLKKRIEKFLNRSNAEQIPFAEKVLIIIKYLELSERKWCSTKCTFSDLKEECTTNAKINTWMTNTCRFNFQNLINEINKYKDIYPIGYKKMCNKINRSMYLLTREREKLINELKIIKEQINNNKTKKLKKIDE